MFTGIIQEIGRIRAASMAGGNMTIDIETPKLAPKTKVGDSVAINGACQTVIACDRDRIKVEAVQETLTRTNLGTLKSGSLVNLELPLSPEDLLHGHLVQGHVDCISTVKEIKPIDGSTLISFDYPPQYKRYLIEKGSIAIDGVSLTITQTAPGILTISIIPHTLASTTFRYRKIGDRVNLEFDIIAKYIERMISPPDSKINYDFLKEHGF
jgi:riboflavin synthase